MNTVWADRDGVHDALATAPDVRAWIAAVGDRLPVDAAALDAWLRSSGPAVVEDLGSRLRDLRDAARRLAAEETVDPRPSAQSPVAGGEDALGVVNARAAEAPTWPSLTWSRDRVPRREIHTDVPPGTALVAGFAALAIELFDGDARAQLRACLAPGCVLYFVKDHPRREWCSSACGNRARVARHYRRHHG
jgi:predicted RNA-binding Zn ribbon-like protein